MQGIGAMEVSTQPQDLAARPRTDLSWEYIVVFRFYH